MSSFLTGRGTDAADAALKDKADFSKALVSLKSGKALKVRVITEAVVSYLCHSAYKSFYSTPCTKPMGKEDFYDKACDILYKEAKAMEEAGATEDEVKAKRNEAYQLKAKERFMIGFINLEDGQPIVIDFTKKQAKTIISKFKEYEDEIADGYAFKLSKSGSSTDTVVSLDIIVNAKKGLSDAEQGHLAASEGIEFNFDIFENVLQINDDKKQLEDLKAFGFDLSKLNVDVDAILGADNGAESTEEGEAPPVEDGEIKADDLGF